MIAWLDPDSRPDRSRSAASMLRWTVAAVVVVAAHGVVVWIALTWRPAVAAPGAPPPAVMIELTPLAVAPEALPQDLAPGLELSEAQPEPPPDVPETPEDTPDEMPELDAEALIKPAEEPPPSPMPQPEAEIPKLPEKQNAEAVLAPPPPRPKPTKKPTPKVRKVERKKPINPQIPKAAQTTAPTASQARRADRAAAPAAGAAQTPSVSPASWRSTLAAHLNRYKRFPPGATSTGTVQVAFTIDRSGRVLSSRLVGSSGDPALDGEAVSLPRRASPVPAPPPNVGGGSIRLAVPIRFNR